MTDDEDISTKPDAAAEKRRVKAAAALVKAENKDAPSQDEVDAMNRLYPPKNETQADEPDEDMVDR